MGMVEDVRGQMMAAMKARDTKRKDVLSNLLAALKNGVIQKRADLTPEEETAIVARELKQTKETLESAPADRQDIAEECRYKIGVLSEFMPEQMDEAQIRGTIEAVLAKLGLEQPTAKQKGIIMRELMPQVKGKADGKQVNEILATYFMA
ncbi:MAG: GatB/YqeY domain-containing protein [Clostridiales bacterium]|nr:MAG: GatB/YqeY domain-containing protein [Clostridiales bacterium]